MFIAMGFKGVVRYVVESQIPFLEGLGWERIVEEPQKPAASGVTSKPKVAKKKQGTPK